MITPGLVINLIFVMFAGHIFYRSYGFLLQAVDPDLSRGFKGNRLHKALYLSGLVIWFSAGVMVMITGLTGLTNRVIIALQ